MRVNTLEQILETQQAASLRKRIRLKPILVVLPVKSALECLVTRHFVSTMKAISRCCAARAPRLLNSARWRAAGFPPDLTCFISAVDIRDCFPNRLDITLHGFAKFASFSPPVDLSMGHIAVVCYLPRQSL